jgi:DNA-binding NarL/FixJ family response regulator
MCPPHGAAPSPFCDGVPVMQGTPATYRLLLVDDAAPVREALRWALEEAADLAVVGEAADGIEAIGQATALEPDAVILDIALPWMDGFAVSRALKSLRHPPVVVFLSVHGDPTSVRRGVEAGGDGFVQKGSGLSELVAELRRALASRPGRDDP